jgi:hypothetical protein
MSFTLFINGNPGYQQRLQSQAVTFQWAAQRLMEYFSLAPNKAYFIARKMNGYTGAQIETGVGDACRLALGAGVPANPIPHATQLLPAAPAAGARLASANALLTGLSAYAHQLLQAGQMAYTSRFNILRQTYMPRDRWAFVSTFYGATEVDAITTVHLRSFLDLLQYRVEADHVRQDHGLRQVPGSFEKHKFFGGPAAAPGLGVLHPIVLTIVLKQSVYQWLQNDSPFPAPGKFRPTFGHSPTTGIPCQYRPAPTRWPSTGPISSAGSARSLTGPASRNPRS